MLYFLEEGPPGIGRVKIGRSARGKLRARLQDLQTGDADRHQVILVLDVTPTKALALETEFKQRFAAAMVRPHSEWFHRTREVMTWLRALEWVKDGVRVRRPTAADLGQGKGG